MRLSSADPAGERLWCRTTLDDVAGLIDGYELWKDGPWYHDVDWQRVSTAVDQVLQQVCRNGAVAMSDLRDPLRRVERTLRQPDAEGLDSLVSWPIEVTRNQLHNAAIGSPRCGLRACSSPPAGACEPTSVSASTRGRSTRFRRRHAAAGAARRSPSNAARGSDPSGPAGAVPSAASPEPSGRLAPTRRHGRPGPTTGRSDGAKRLRGLAPARSAVLVQRHIRTA